MGLSVVKLRAAVERAARGAAGPAGIYLLATVLARAGGFILIPLYTRKLGVEEYGDYALAQTLIALLPMLLSLGLGSALVRFYYDGDDSAAGRRRVAGVARWMATITFGFALVLQLGLLAIRPPGGHGIYGRWELSCVIWAGAGAAVAGVPALYLRAAKRPLAAAAFQLGQFFSLAGAGLFLVAGLHRGLRGTIEAAALAFVVDGLVGLGYMFVALKGPMPRKLLREALRFSLPFVPHVMANQLQQISDRWTMKADGFEAALGRYALANQLVAPVMMGLSAWNDAVTPDMGEQTREGGLGAVRRVFGATQRAYLMVTGGLSAAVVAFLPLAALAVGGNFKQALWIVPFLCVALLIETLYFPSCNVVFFASRPDVIPKITITAALLNIALNLLLVRWYGVAGALASRYLSMGFRSFAMWRAARRCFAEAA